MRVRCEKGRSGPQDRPTVTETKVRAGTSGLGRQRHAVPRQIAKRLQGFLKHWLWRAVDQTGIVLDVLVQRRRDKQAAKRLLRNCS